MSFREAKRAFHISYLTWARLRRGEVPGWQPGGARFVELEATIDKVLASVKVAPHLNSAIRAKELHIGATAVQRILAERSLSRLTARLRFAGYKVEAVHPLAVARQRRVLAAAPGALTCSDFKTFAKLELPVVAGGERGTQVRPVCGCLVVDHFTGFLSCTLSDGASASVGVAALDRFRAKAPWTNTGLLLTDNGPSFLADEYIAGSSERGYRQRTTRYNHPWSNGKVEAANKTLKYQCFPALCASRIESMEHLQGLVDVWLDDYNARRSHGGWINKGLPPLAVWERWRSLPGSVLDRLAAMRILSATDMPRMRVMGTDKSGATLLTQPLADCKGVPFAFVIERGSQWHPSGERMVPGRAATPTRNVTLAR
jgi:transposase InsO family protein